MRSDPIQGALVDSDRNNLVKDVSSFAVFDKAKLRDNVDQWRRRLGANRNKVEPVFDLVYNTNPYVLEQVSSSLSKCTFGVRSKMELAVALNDIGLRGDQLSLRAPLLTKGLLQGAMKAEVDTVRVTQPSEVAKTCNFFPGAKLVLEVINETSFQSLLESALTTDTAVVGLALPWNHELSLEKGLGLLEYALNLCTDFDIYIDHIDVSSWNIDEDLLSGLVERLGGSVIVRISCAPIFLKGCFELHAKIASTKKCETGDNSVFVLTSSATALLAPFIMKQLPVPEQPSIGNGSGSVESNEGLVIADNINVDQFIKDKWLILKDVIVSTAADMVALEDTNGGDRCLLLSCPNRLPKSGC